MAREELADWVRLSLTPGLGNSGARKLLAAFGLPATVFGASITALQQVVSPALAQAVQAIPPKFPETWRQTLAWLDGDDALATRQVGAQGFGVRRRIVTLGDAAYPAALLEMEDPPLLLYLLGAGDFDAMPASRCIAIVGSRNPTPQGADNARQFARALTAAGLTVVSGLALGVDGAAHEGALQDEPIDKNPAKPDAPTPDIQAAAARVRTVAVVGTGLDRVYPRQHLDLAHRIAGQGLLVSEYPLGTPPLAANFPRRNRLIAGLSRATLVVEAALQSGSLVTARLASEQGKDVLAIPGSIHAAQSRGCHALIKQGAKLVESAEDVLEEFGHSFAIKKIADTAGGYCAEPVKDSEKSLLEALGFDPVGLDAMQARTGLPTPALQAALFSLEMQGRLARLPGGLFQRVGAA